jgi:prephenate dehydratase
MVVVGYMGIPGSNSEQAAIDMSERMGWDEPTLVPLMDSKGVVDGLRNGSCEYGVLAVANITAGPVEETEMSLAGVDHDVILDQWFPIHHCIFVRNPDVTIKHISSHIQALLQTKEHLDSLYPDADRIACEDTALAAENLGKGLISENTAVVCRRNAGEMFGLTMVHENIEDRTDNMTQFHLIRLR